MVRREVKRKACRRRWHVIVLTDLVTVAQRSIIQLRHAWSQD